MSAGEFVVPLALLAVAAYSFMTIGWPRIRAGNLAARRYAQSCKLIGQYGKAPSSVTAKMNRIDACNAFLSGVKSYSGLGGAYNVSAREDGETSLVEGKIIWTESRYNKLDFESKQNATLFTVGTEMVLTAKLTSVDAESTLVDWHYQTTDIFNGPGSAEHLEPALGPEKICDATNFLILKNLGLVSE